VLVILTQICVESAMFLIFFFSKSYTILWNLWRHTLYSTTNTKWNFNLQIFIKRTKIKWNFLKICIEQHKCYRIYSMQMKGSGNTKVSAIFNTNVCDMVTQKPVIDFKHKACVTSWGFIYWWCLIRQILSSQTYFSKCWRHKETSVWKTKIIVSGAKLFFRCSVQIDKWLLVGKVSSPTPQSGQSLKFAIRCLMIGFKQTIEPQKI